MASPQKEHGFTPIAHELLRAYMTQDHAAQQWRCLMGILIDSYGQSRKVSFLTQTEIAKMTGLSRSRVNEAIRELVRRNMIFRHLVPENRTPPRVPENRNMVKIAYEINKNYDTWVSGKPERSGKPEHGGVPARTRAGASEVFIKKEKNKSTRTLFTAPTAEEVTAYGLSIGFPLDGEHFCAYYEARGWQFKRGQPMKSWKHAVVTWKKNGYTGQGSNGSAMKGIPEWMKA